MEMANNPAAPVGRGQAAPDPVAAVPEAGLFDDVTALLEDLRRYAHDHLQLVTLESQRAGEALAAMLAFGIAVGVLLVSTWLIVLGALVLTLIHSGVTTNMALLLALLMNICGVFGLVVAIRHKSRYLRFPALIDRISPRHESAVAPGADKQ